MHTCRADRVTLIHHGLDVLKFPLADETTRRAAREKLGVPLDARVAAFVGRFDNPKNERWMVDLAARMPNLHVLMKGEGPREAELKDSIARRMTSTSRAKSSGPRNPIDAYQAADALPLPSIREGFSLYGLPGGDNVRRHADFSPREPPGRRNW